MELTERITTSEVGSALNITYQCYKDMFDNNIIFGYRGIVTSDLVTNVLDIMEERLEEDGQSRRLSKKVFNVMVECLTNVYVGEDKLGKPAIDPTALLLVKRVSNAYHVTTGSFIPTQSVTAIKSMIDRINEMDKSELRVYYQEVLCLEEPVGLGGGMSNLAIIDLARKSKHRLVYQFKFENEYYTFFTLESQISKNSI